MQISASYVVDVNLLRDCTASNDVRFSSRACKIWTNLFAATRSLSNECNMVCLNLVSVCSGMSVCMKHLFVGRTSKTVCCMDPVLFVEKFLRWYPSVN